MFFLCPHFVSLPPSPSLLIPAHCLSPLSVMFPLLELRTCQTSHFFLLFSPLIVLLQILFSYIWDFSPGMSTPFLLSPLSLSFKTSLRQFWGAGEEAVEGSWEERVWPPTLQHSIVLHWFRHVHSLTHTQTHKHKIGHTLRGVIDPLFYSPLIGEAYSLGIRAVH